MLTEVKSAPIDTRVPHIVRVENAALDESANSSSGMVVRGRIASSTLRFLKVDPNYQRHLQLRADIWEALKKGDVVPDIDIGVRGENISFPGDDCLIKSECYIIDGWQRVGNALRLLDAIPDMEIRIGALFHFNTNQAWEAERFTSLNNNTKRVAANLHLRNLRDKSNSVLTLYGITKNEPACPFYKRVCWDQNKSRNELIGSLLLARVCLSLHAHKATNGSASQVDAVARYLDEVASAVSLSRFRANCLSFIQLIEECWGIRSISYVRAAPQIKSTFLYALARTISSHRNFWSDDGNTLAVSPDDRRKLAGFPVNDPFIAQLASSVGPARGYLFDRLVGHMNSGRRHNFLEPWTQRSAAR